MTLPALRGAGPLSPQYSDAAIWAAQLHREQVRKGTKIPYLAHLLSVSALVLEDGGTESEAIAALLHDAAEDVGREVLEEVEQRYGTDVRRTVEECSDDLPSSGQTKRSWVERKREYVRHLPQASESALRIGAADKLHNLRSTVQDLREGTWPPFNACRHQLLWYYDALVAGYLERLPASRTARELDRLVDEFAGLIDAARPVERLPEPPTCSCSAAAAS